MSNNSGLSKRAALRQQQEMEERRKRTSRIVGASLGAIGLVVVVVLAIVIFQAIGRSQSQTENQQTPPNATADKGIEKASQGEPPAKDAPHVVVYEDFQCPACASREEGYGPAFNRLVDEGLITIEYVFATFMENRIGNDSSTRAAIAVAAADSVGKFREMHSIIYANQSSSGAGYTDQQLRVDFPAQAGIEGEELATYQELYDTRAFADFVRDSNQAFSNDSPTQSTPTYLVGDEVLVFFDEETQTVLIQPTPEDIYRAIMEIA